MSRRVVILSPGGEYLDALLARLAARGTPADALILYLPGVVREWRRITPASRRIASSVLVPLRWGWRRIRQRMTTPPAAGARQVVRSGTLNGRRMISDLRRLAPDVVILAACSLVAPEVLAIARAGTVNVHPGLLPWVRGNGPFANALLRSVPLGCTAFWVDEGIDTGPILARALVPVRGGETVPRLRDALFAHWVEMTADVIASALSGADLPRVPQDRRFPLGRRISAPASLADVENAVASGLPKTLFDGWMPFCDGDLRLPPAADARVAAAFPRAGTPPRAPAAARDER